jgi:plasmid stabilization system protein ParE
VARDVRLSRQAARDLDRVAAFLAQANPRAAREAKAAIVAAVLNLSTLADRGRPAAGRPNHRELVVPFGRDGYIVRYRVQADHVVVARIRHSREDH